MEEDVTDSSRNLGSAEMLQGMPPTRRLFASRLCNAKPDQIVSVTYPSMFL